MKFMLGLVSVAGFSLGCAHVRVRPSPQAEAHLRAGVVALESGDVARADAELALALAYQPRMPEALNASGLAALRRGDPKSARRLFSEAISERPDFVEAHSNLGALDLTLHDPERALPHLNAALAIDPGYLAARKNLAQALGLLGRVDELRFQLLELTSLSPEDADSWFELSRVELELDHDDSATRALATALRVNPRHVSARRAKAGLDVKNGRIEAAREQLETLVRQNPDDFESRMELTFLPFYLGRPHLVVNPLIRIEIDYPYVPRIHFLLGVVLEEMGELWAALGAYRMSLDLSRLTEQRNPEAEVGYDRVLAKVGHERAQLQAYQTRLEQQELAVKVEHASEVDVESETEGPEGAVESEDGVELQVEW